MQRTSFRDWWSPAKSAGGAARKRVNFASCRWQEMQKRLSRSLAASPARKRAETRAAPPSAPAPSASVRSTGPPAPRSAHGHGVDRREDDVAGGAEPAAARRDRARRRRDAPHWRRLLGPIDE